jgi:hypothetical protein
MEEILKMEKPIFISSLLRLIILKLPIPIFGFESYGIFLELAKTEKEKMEKEKKIWIFKSLIQRLDTFERNVLNVLICLLTEIDLVNDKMKVKNFKIEKKKD